MTEPPCPGSIERLLEIVEGKWTLLLLRHLFNGVKRFGVLRRVLHPISPKTLTERLRLLEERGIVTRTMYSEVPLHVEYQLTERGRRLEPIFVAMGVWVQSEASGPKNEPVSESLSS
jgi:DNA-binding HxlR family transcriptional regulator